MHSRLNEIELTDAALSGATICGPGDETVGKGSHLHGPDSEGQAIIDVGGFFSIGAEPVALPDPDLDFMRDENGTLHGVAHFDKETLKALPEQAALARPRRVAGG